jgi:hypothetical protein
VGDRQRDDYTGILAFSERFPYIQNMTYFMPGHWNVLHHGKSLAENIIRKETSWNVNGRYDVMTLAGSARGQKAENGVFAQLYRLDEEADQHYRVFLRDDEILRFLKTHEDIDLLSFITFLMTHELLHIHRFSTGKADFFGSCPEEELLVDALTRVFLAKNPVVGLKKVLVLLDKLEAAPLYNNHILNDGGKSLHAYL